MSELLDRVITSLRQHHDVLAARVADLTDEQLDAPSGAAKWTVAQALSHLGSGAELVGIKPLATALGLPVSDEDNQTVWARWDEATPRQQAEWYVERDAAFLELVEGLDAQQRESLRLDLGFLPEPSPLELVLGMRLNEVANHAWDVLVGLDPDAEVDPAAAAVVLELLEGPLAFLLGFSAQAAEVDDVVRLEVPGGSITIDDGVRVSIGPVEDPTARLDGPAGAAVRLISGRLREGHADGVEVSGNVTLEQLRQVFPGY